MAWVDPKVRAYAKTNEKKQQIIKERKYSLNREMKCVTT